MHRASRFLNAHSSGGSCLPKKNPKHPKQPDLPGGSPPLSDGYWVSTVWIQFPGVTQPEKVAQNLADAVNDTACALEVQHTSLNINSWPKQMLGDARTDSHIALSFFSAGWREVSGLATLLLRLGLLCPLSRQSQHPSERTGAPHLVLLLIASSRWLPV